MQGCRLWLIRTFFLSLFSSQRTAGHGVMGIRQQHAAGPRQSAGSANRKSLPSCDFLLRNTLAERIGVAQACCGTLLGVTDPRDELAAATRRYRHTEAAHEKARQVAIDAVLTALRANIGPTEVERLSPFTSAYIRKLARENGIPPASPGPKKVLRPGLTQSE